MDIYGYFLKSTLLFFVFNAAVLNGLTYAQDYKSLTELEVLQKIPSQVLKDLAGAGMPDQKGMVGRNRNGWIHVAFQRGAAFSFVAAVALGDLKSAERAWNAIEVGFLKQMQEGNFELGEFEGKKPRKLDDYSGVSFWLASVSRAILVVRESEFNSSFKERIEILLPKIEKSANWLLKHKEELKDYDIQTANRLFFDALAFGLCGLLLNKEELSITGNNFLKAGLSMQKGDGVLLEEGGYDSSYQATSLINMQIYRIYFPGKELEKAITKAFQWELGRIEESGRINVKGNTRIGRNQEKLLGKIKKVSYQDVVLSLFYYGILTNNSNAASVAEKVYLYKKDNPGQ